MRHAVVILDKMTGAPRTGYTVRLYAYSSGVAAGYSTPLYYTYTDNLDGSYYTDITTSIKGTVVITLTGSTFVMVPVTYKGRWFEGENQPTRPVST
jgi:hypothetical protein